jgi:hypothetical protein
MFLRLMIEHLSENFVLRQQMDTQYRSLVASRKIQNQESSIRLSEWITPNFFEKL